jgi:hypothetical protein
MTWTHYTLSLTAVLVTWLLRSALVEAVLHRNNSLALLQQELGVSPKTNNAVGPTIWNSGDRPIIHDKKKLLFDGLAALGIIALVDLPPSAGGFLLTSLLDHSIAFVVLAITAAVLSMGQRLEELAKVFTNYRRGRLLADRSTSHQQVKVWLNTQIILELGLGAAPKPLGWTAAVFAQGSLGRARLHGLRTQSFILADHVLAILLLV